MKKGSHGKRRQLSKPARTLGQLQDKLGALAAGMNREVDFYALLEAVVCKTPLSLQIPETLLLLSDSDSVFFLTERDGYVRVTRGHATVSDFLTTCSVKNKAMRDLNPLGVKYPKFVTFRDGKLEFTLRKVEEVRRYIRDTDKPARIQRYVVPCDYTVAKTLLHWRRVKTARAYCLQSRDSLTSTTPRTTAPKRKTDQIHLELTPNFQLDTSYLASTHNIQFCSIVKCPRLTDHQSELITLFRRVLKEEVVQVGEELEEFLVHMMQSRDSKWYVLDLPCAVVSGREEDRVLPLHLRSFSLELSTDTSEASKAPTLPSSPHPHSARTSKSQFSNSLSTHVAEMSELIDELRTKGRLLKEESSVLKKIKLERYSKELLARVIHNVYLQILRDSRLSRYYLDKTRVHSKVESSIRQVFFHGCSRFMKARVLATHANMGISSPDFDLYIHYFGEALRAQGVGTEDMEAALEFLKGFKPYVVQSKQ